MTTKPYEFSIGEVQGYVIHDFTQAHLPEELIANPDPDGLNEVAREVGFDPQAISVGYHNLLLRTQQHTILVDAGIPRLYGELGWGLSELKIASADIDTLVITHSDMDHIAGILDEQNQITFPGARYIMLEGGWEFWTSAEKRTRLAELNNWSEGNAQRAWEIYGKIKSSIRTVRPGEEFLPGMRLFPAPGHRADHSMLKVTGSDQTLIHLADALAHPLFMRQVDWVSTYDANPAQAVKTKLELMEMCAEEEALVFASHFPFPGLGRIRQQPGGWIWQPLGQE
jgi:glyoxylase-like metal-dependent hydrolase (beta-lactamase superfamily II)